MCIYILHAYHMHTYIKPFMYLRVYMVCQIVLHLTLINIYLNDRDITEDVSYFQFFCMQILIIIYNITAQRLMLISARTQSR